MKLKQVNNNSKGAYPKKSEFRSMRAIKNILIGTSITASLVLMGCSDKKDAAKETTPSLPSNNADSSTDNGKEPVVPPTKDPNGDKKPVKITKLGEIRAPRHGNDKDNDGVVDANDKCPTVAGPKSNNGCPRPQLRGKMLTPRHP